MNLSLKKQWGRIHVRGGRLLKVVHEHGVDTRGQSVKGAPPTTPEASKPFKPRALGNNANARVGDLAIEIVNVKAGNVLGYSYLSGDAIQINSYLIRPDRYEEAVLQTAVFPPVPEVEPEDPTAFIDAFRNDCVGMKFNREVDVFAFEATAVDDETSRSIAEMILDFYQLIPTAMPDSALDDNRSHLIGSVQAPKGHLFHLHCQPKKHASDFACTPFQAGLCTSSLAARHQRS